MLPCPLSLGTSPVIERAKGVLIALRGSTADQAFADLQNVPQTHNIKLNASAPALVDAAAVIDWLGERESA
jgi:AmiR/NasT family two-component response regulator